MPATQHRMHAVAQRGLARPHARLAWTSVVALALAASITAARGQSSVTPPDAPPAAQPSTPAEIQPGHGAGANSTIVAPSTGSSGPQTAAPTPLPPGTAADTPGGTARNGVIAPPPTAGDPGMNRGAPQAGTMRVIPPPGTAGNATGVTPK